MQGHEGSDSALGQGAGAPLASHFSSFLARLAGQEAGLRLAAELLCRQVDEGDICLNLATYQGRQVETGQGRQLCPGVEAWCRELRAAGVVGEPGDFAPLVLDGVRLYLYRYWEYERRLGEFLERVAGETGEVELDRLRAGLGRYFPSCASGEVDWQAVAAVAAAHRRFCVVTGGAGTGKTSTVVKILALLAEQLTAASGSCRVLLAAPTGKAAARLQEAVAAAKESLALPRELAVLIPDAAMTLHRLLGAIPGSPSFRHGRTNPLPADVVVVDEASMVDLPMMAKLVDALEPDCRLLLLGDRNQLASVEPGSVFADICQPVGLTRFSAGFADTLRGLTGMAVEDGGGPLSDSLVELRRSYRFTQGGGVEQLGQAVLAGDVEGVVQLLEDPALPEVGWREVVAESGLQAALTGLVEQGCYDYLAAAEPAAAFAGFERFMLLCAVRLGGFGVEAVNRQVENLLRRSATARGGQVVGQPVMVTRNDYNVGLFNGDIGILLRGGQGERGVYFKRPAEKFVAVPEYRLPPAEKAFAMTVHKSQGSEFERVVVLLPEVGAPVLSRELLYTAITRARGGLEIWGRREVLAATVQGVVQRDSGLRERLFSRLSRA